ncbi:MAG: YIP1 family protein [Planctomycetes bacterium]|nr:YIP1 family protein [Planctomycetota bacterium]
MTTFEQTMQPVPVQTRSLNPWFTMWLHPRATTREILDTDPARLVIALAMFGGVLNALDHASVASLGEELSVPMIFALAIPVGMVAGVIALYLGAALIRWTGSWLGGQASAGEVRAALAWGHLPVYFAAVLWLPYLGFFGNEIFMSEMPSVQARPWLLLVLLNLAVLEKGLVVWGLVTLVLAVAEAHRFSGWRSLGSIVMAVLVLIVPLMMLAVLLFLANW